MFLKLVIGIKMLTTEFFRRAPNLLQKFEATEETNVIFDKSCNPEKKAILSLYETILTGRDFDISFYIIDNKYCIFGVKLQTYYKYETFSINLYNKKLQLFHKMFEDNFSSRNDINLFLINEFSNIQVDKYIENKNVKHNYQSFVDFKCAKLGSYIRLLNEEIEIKKYSDVDDTVTLKINLVDRE